jgi:hypothetical protein
MHLGCFCYFKCFFSVFFKVIRSVLVFFKLIYKIFIWESCWSMFIMCRRVDGVCDFETASAMLPDGLTWPFTIFFKAPSCHLPSCVARKGIWWSNCYWWSFLFFFSFFFLLPKKVHDYSPCSLCFNFNPYYINLLFLLYIFYKSFFFQFNFLITISHMLFSSSRSLFFWFLIFSLVFLLKFCCLSISSFNQSLYYFILFNLTITFLICFSLYTCYFLIQFNPPIDFFSPSNLIFISIFTFILLITIIFRSFCVTDFFSFIVSPVS